jgi:hypothetical protein
MNQTTIKLSLGGGPLDYALQKRSYEFTRSHLNGYSLNPLNPVRPRGI